jgi:hypothetical protein
MTKLVNPIGLDVNTRRALIPLRAELDEVVALLNSTAWTTLTLTAPWANYGFGWATAAYQKVGDTVRVRGLIAGGTSGSTIATLPAGFRPTGGTITSAQLDFGSGYQTARLDVSTSGVMIAYWNSAAPAGYLAMDVNFSVL